MLNSLVKLRHLSRERNSVRVELRSLATTYRVFGRHYRKYKSVLIVAYVALLATIGVTVLAPWPLKLILDHVILDQPVPAGYDFLNPLFAMESDQVLLILAIAIVVLAIIQAVFSFINKYLIASTGHRLGADIRERVFAHLQRLSLSFHDSTRSGNIVYLLTSDIRTMKSILINFPQTLIKDSLTLCFSIVLMVALEWRLAIITLSVVPLLLICTSFFGKGVKAAMTQRRKKEGEVASLVAENARSIAMIQAFGQEEGELNRFRTENQESLAARLQGLGLTKTYKRLVDILVTLGMAGVLYFGGRFALDGQLLPGTLVVFVAYTRGIYGDFQKLSDTLLSLARSQVSAERLVDLVKNDMVTRDAPNALPAPRLKGNIEFKQVNFSYNNHRSVLRDLSFTVTAGETVALVGHSGVGKSTLISLLLRFYDPNSGQILIDGQDISTMTLRSLRDQMTILLQDAKLFQQSVRENIIFGRYGATDESMIRAAKLAEAHDFIMEMPFGYATPIHEGGENLSGGQRQRINIARAIIRDTPIVVLDEPATGLDSQVENRINAAIQRLTQGKTTFIIAHKLASVANADKILLLDEGRLVHEGTHGQLLQSSEQYRQFYSLQTGRQIEMDKIEID